MYRFCAYSEKRIGRKTNNDQVMIGNMVLHTPHHCGQTKDKFIAIICDGVGSTAGGAWAANITANSFVDFDVETCSPLIVSRHLHKVNRLIVAEQNRTESAYDMASTVAGLLIIANKYLTFNLGDTRIYQYHKGGLFRITKDHVIAGASGNAHLPHDAVSGYVGGDGFACFPSFKKGKTDIGDVFMMCSDGVYKNIREDDLKNLLGSETAIEYKAGAILQKSLKNNSTDDRSLVLVEHA